MRQTGNKRTEITQGQPDRSTRAKAVKSEDTTPITQEELLQWWPFTRLDPKRFPRTTRNNDYEEALL